eukprot:c12969_g3_i1.p1 GENE.c12969_g3_i1~~c12969_g3_i1.p1  ORF type:complete len:239 (-),score=41.50 c12969_g3_i1:121-807(-)
MRSRERLQARGIFRIEQMMGGIGCLIMATTLLSLAWFLRQASNGPHVVNSTILLVCEVEWTKMFLEEQKFQLQVSTMSDKKPILAEKTMTITDCTDEDSCLVELNIARGKNVCLFSTNTTETSEPLTNKENTSTDQNVANWSSRLITIRDPLVPFDDQQMQAEAMILVSDSLAPLWWVWAFQLCAILFVPVCCLSGSMLVASGWGCDVSLGRLSKLNCEFNLKDAHVV